jgi:RNA polymerase sigma factor (sigma-70 family)
MEQRILVIDDEPMIVDGLTAWLQIENLAAAGANDRHTAAAMLEEQHYPVIVADLCITTCEEGLLLIDEIRRLSPASRIITMTGYASPEMATEVLERGASRIVFKTGGDEVILQAILEVLEEIEHAADAREEIDLEALYLHTSKVLRSIPQRRYGLSAQQAEDVVQDAWLLFLEKRGYVRTPRTWLAGTVSKLCLQQLDRMRRRQTENDGELLESLMDPRGTDRDTKMIVRQAMSRLDARSRELCTQIAIEGRSYAEVSTSLSLPIGSVGPLYMRAKNKLRQALDCWRRSRLCSPSPAGE